MTLTALHIHNLRNFITTKAHLAPKFNLLHGLNGSGKTSFLEAIYYLGLGRSFRTKLNTRLIHHQAQQFSLFAQLTQNQQTIPLGLERHANGTLHIRLAQQTIRSMLELTKILPLQLLNTESRLLLFGPSKIRRQFIDWGVFHVEPTFIIYWQQAQRILKQRNAALKQRTLRATIQAWDQELEPIASALTQFRRNYIHEFIPVFFKLLTSFFDPPEEISIEYHPGWNEAYPLSQALEQTWLKDLQLGYTHIGPHRADLFIRYSGLPIQDVFSQGQQKLVIYALRLAQGILLQQQTDKQCIYLLDDLPAELDLFNCQKVAAVLQQMDAQAFITGVSREALIDFEHFSNSAMFHVKQNGIYAAS